MSACFIKISIPNAILYEFHTFSSGKKIKSLCFLCQNMASILYFFMVTGQNYYGSILLLSSHTKIRILPNHKKEKKTNKTSLLQLHVEITMIVITLSLTFKITFLTLECSVFLKRGADQFIIPPAPTEGIYVQVVDHWRRSTWPLCFRKHRNGLHQMIHRRASYQSLQCLKNCIKES